MTDARHRTDSPRPLSSRPLYRHEELKVWHAAVDYAASIYRLTTFFPSDERFALTNQLRRAAVSVSSNIAEGNGRFSNRDNLRFVEIAYGSLMETLSQIAVAARLGYLSEEQNDEIREEAAPIARMLSGLRSSLQKRSAT